MRIVCEVLVAAVLFWGCDRSRGPEDSSSGSGVAAAATIPLGGGATGKSTPGATDPQAHFDHRPRHGGLVLMNGDLHFEVVFDPAGQHRVYFTDAVRRDLPAAIASEVTLTVTRKEGPPETLHLHIDPPGGSWIASGRPVTDPQATVRVAYTVGKKPYFIDLPFVRPTQTGGPGARSAF